MEEFGILVLEKGIDGEAFGPMTTCCFTSVAIFRWSG